MSQLLCWLEFWWGKTDSIAHCYCFTIGFFYTLSALILWHLKYTLVDPTDSSQGLHILRKICGAEGGFDWLVRTGDEGILFTKGNFVILESC